MTTATLKYSLDIINDIIFHGFEYSIPEETMKIISELALQVGSPDYVKTPVFAKRENPMKSDAPVQNHRDNRKKKGRANEIISDDDWNAIRNFQATKIEEKTGVNAHIDSIRVLLNKLTDKNYIDMVNKITDELNKMIEDNISEEEFGHVSSIIFDIASTNRFYSKIYAELYADLSTKYSVVKATYEAQLQKFTDLFNNIEYVDADKDYDRFCEINKVNEKRKALASFYINLMLNGVISKKEIMTITRNLLANVYEFIQLEDKKNEVDELTETVSLLYKKELYDEDDGEEYNLIEGFTIKEIVEKVANSKVKDYKSLTNKSLFKFMDLIDM